MTWLWWLLLTIGCAIGVVVALPWAVELVARVLWWWAYRSWRRTGMSRVVNEGNGNGKERAEGQSSTARGL